jgi:endoglycosylceramidase
MRGQAVFHSIAVCLVFSSVGFSASQLDLLHADSDFIRDKAGRVVILRGVTTITLDNNGREMVMRNSDYERLRGWGFNVQQIRVEGCKIGLIAPCRIDAGYLDKLASWVDMAAQHGIYTIMKATLYDVPGFDWQSISRPKTWDRIWDGGSSVESTYINGWKAVWQRFVNNPNVAGYDFLNEPRPGSDERDFTRRHLFPLYRKGAAALREVDPSKIFFFQPSIAKSGRLEKLGVRNAVFAPHFYVIPQRYSADQLIKALLRAPSAQDVPMIMGEYGDPNVPIAGLKAGTTERDIEDADIFDQHALGAIRPWYTTQGWWALLKPDGTPHGRISVFSRPYPQRIAGTPESWQYDFDRRTLTFHYRADSSARARTEIYVPRQIYEDGFELSTSDGLRINSRERSCAKESRALSYDASNQILTIANPARSGARSINIEPQSADHRASAGRRSRRTSRL